MTIWTDLKMKFGCRWERIRNPPNWVSYKSQYFNHETIRQIKGKNFIYKVVKGTPLTQGADPTVFYRRLRYSAWKRMQK